MVTAAGAKARKSAPRSLYPRGAELDYAAKLRRRLRAAARAVRGALVDGDFEAVRFDSSASDEDRVRREIGRVRLAYFEKYTEVTDESLALEIEGQVTGYIERQTARQVQAILGVDVLPTAGLKYQASEFTRDSVALIRSVGEEFFQDLEADILQAMQGGARWEQLSSVIAERYGLSAKRANLIARDQMGTLVSKISQAKQQAAGATKYIWRTSEDERVVGAPGNRNKPNMRHGDHYARNGKLFTWDRPPHDGHPGEAINCRCTAEPVWDDEEVDAKPADESDLVFDPVAVAKKAAEEIDRLEKWKRKPPVLVDAKLDASEADRLLDKSTAYWKSRLGGMTRQERVAEMKAIRAELLSNRFDLATVADVKISGHVSGKVDGPAAKKRAKELEHIYSEIGNMVGQAPLGDRLSNEKIHHTPHMSIPVFTERRVDTLNVEYKGPRAYFTEMSSGMPSLKVQKDGSVAYQNEIVPTINFGRVSKTKEEFKATQYHEFGHYIEKRNPRVFEASVRFLEKRTEGKNLEKLSKITGNPNYDSKEVARDGDFFDPYVGKEYRNSKGEYRATEVLSMGLQEFVSEDRMNAFYEKDPEHFAHIMNVLGGEYGYRKPD